MKDRIKILIKEIKYWEEKSCYGVGNPNGLILQLTDEIQRLQYEGNMHCYNCVFKLYSEKSDKCSNCTIINQSGTLNHEHI